MGESKHTKNEYRNAIKDMSKKELLQEKKDLKLMLLKSKVDIQKGVNPYQTTKEKNHSYNIKLIKWKLRQLIK